MSKLIEILPNVYGVKVPMDAEYKIENLNEDGEFEESTILILDTLDYLELPSKNFNILGFLTKDEISFDASEFGFKDEQSFRSALPEEIYFENPLGEKPFYSDLMFIYMNYKSKKAHQNKLNAWQTAQENITHKLLILQKL